MYSENRFQHLELEAQRLNFFYYTSVRSRDWRKTTYPNRVLWMIVDIKPRPKKQCEVWSSVVLTFISLHIECRFNQTLPKLLFSVFAGLEPFTGTNKYVISYKGCYVMITLQCLVTIETVSFHTGKVELTCLNYLPPWFWSVQKSTQHGKIAETISAENSE